MKTTDSKSIIQMVNINNNYGNSYHLPISAGMLVSYAKSFDYINDNFVFRPIIFANDLPEQSAHEIYDADILALSCYVWSWNMSMSLAREVKRLNPGCKIIVGGPHVPKRLGSFFNDNPFIDVACHGRGRRLSRIFFGCIAAAKNSMRLMGYHTVTVVMVKLSQPSPENA